MLANIHVKNMALIKEADISLGKGLNILSGETGAGKSILLGSIAVALGLQNFKGFAREDADYALSELVFVIENEEQRQALLELEIPVEDGEVIISRRLSKGRTTSKINGETVPVSMVSMRISLFYIFANIWNYSTILREKSWLWQKKNIMPAIRNTAN